MSWFPKKQPKARIAGMHLTRDETVVLLEICQTLKHILKKQTEAIRYFPKTKPSHNARSALKVIQERHSTCTEQLHDLILRLRTHHCKEPWTRELDDAQAAMRRKVVRCNAASHALAMGWKAAAEVYWPRIAENYTSLLSGLVKNVKQNLQDALEDETTWSEEEVKKRNHRTSLEAVKSALEFSPRSKPTFVKGKHIAFDDTVHWRKFVSVDAPKEVGEELDDFTTKVASDRKRSTISFHERAAERRRVARLTAEQYWKGQAERRDEAELGGEEERREEDGTRPRGDLDRYFDDLQETRFWVPL